jgi:hypothetical protein
MPTERVSGTAAAAAVAAAYHDWLSMPERWFWKYLCREHNLRIHVRHNFSSNPAVLFKRQLSQFNRRGRLGCDPLYRPDLTRHLRRERGRKTCVLR